MSCRLCVKNTQVIHAGIHYGIDSLKAKLCIKGKQLLYDLCEKRSIPYRNTRKWTLAQDEAQLKECLKVHETAQILGVPTMFVGAEEAKRREPDVRARVGILESPTTGIVDAHSLMTYLLGDFEDRGGDCALQTKVTGLEALQHGAAGYKIRIQSADGSEDEVTAESLVNCAGHYACEINNMLLPAERHRKAYFAKGTYFSYSASSPRPSILLYPAPRPGLGGLGTHLTLDMAGRVRFGPDIEWIDDPNDLKPSAARLEAAVTEIRDYLPGIRADAIDLDYCGIRPKLQGSGNQDFVIQKEEGFPGFINLLGIESPGLTSSLAIGEMVEDLLYR
jgi:L-2-hydroxyglutarate oxidase LhgO